MPWMCRLAEHQDVCKEVDLARMFSYLLLLFSFCEWVLQTNLVFDDIVTIFMFASFWIDKTKHISFVLACIGYCFHYFDTCSSPMTLTLQYGPLLFLFRCWRPMIGCVSRMCCTTWLVRRKTTHWCLICRISPSSSTFSSLPASHPRSSILTHSLRYFGDMYVW